MGYENVIRMYPLDLREFFTALGLQPDAFDLLEECFEEKREVPAAVHERVMRMTRLYLACGGMPAAVDQLVKTQDLALVLGTQRDIAELYRQDIARYAQNKPHVKKR